ncbi:hypothetical protein MPTK1_3g14090 [Marchantia polymorpha subsp. ruderalis]|uniref:Protein kinase domain-containing protein n=4 Tax=Marchantia polymorpha TaxID=3197 RepID=A0AAF6B0L5_MARPO|nr:hypothetical protein MARPO_0004s0262 [Marchantia polymorpha]PTQ49033.1 hypothetical protein MARPO_0004s0262 [Marchantia polymorpha]PTQ49034.1 hypothetical protein MARPO_0004s0262 [Marchantia polymorpha]BBN05549.1 hypothetical protein Mp_3g14090 [Marchantia polymorpha subsp. ruderalis]|eukprot:PTQ49032.1 hypothetical protein MARPO_0004s0262 [Marchantia polymorpha]
MSHFGLIIMAGREREGNHAFIRVKFLNGNGEINRYYRRLHVLGEGGYGKTYEVEHVRNGRRYAMKVQKFERVAPGAVATSSTDPFEDVRIIYKEMVILNLILPRHRNIINIKDLLMSVDTVYIVLELCARKCLRNFYPIANNRSGRRIFKQIVQATHFLHQHGVIHMDLHSENVLFTDDTMTESKIIDFGLAVYKPELAVRVHANFNHHQWFDIDDLSGLIQDYSGPHEDIQALGHILHCILAGTEVDPERFEQPRPEAEAEGEGVTPAYMPRMHIFDREAKDLLELIGPEYFRRGALPTMDRVLTHPWLA